MTSLLSSTKLSSDDVEDITQDTNTTTRNYGDRKFDLDEKCSEETNTARTETYKTNTKVSSDDVEDITQDTNSTTATTRNYGDRKFDLDEKCSEETNTARTEKYKTNTKVSSDGIEDIIQNTTTTTTTTTTRNYGDREFDLDEKFSEETNTARTEKYKTNTKMSSDDIEEITQDTTNTTTCDDRLFVLDEKLSEETNTTRTEKNKSTFSPSELENMHPLLRYDPDILDGGFELVKLEYFEAETTRAPVPRNQDVPKSAFGTLTGTSILVATSHAWFYQNHPDPRGVKLEILRKEFFPRLRMRFPHTEILVFDDWHSCPQWPRNTQEENNRFQKCMDHMNSIYCYCDVVLFVDSPLPDIDNTIFSCDLVPSEHEWLSFIDTIQYVKGDNKKLTIRRCDIVVGVNNTKETTIDVLKEKKDKTTISFLRRPYGRPNRTPAGERGWLYAEQVSVAIRMAAATPDVFDDVVMSNSLDLTIRICGWSNELRKSSRKEKKHPGSIAYQLEIFRAALGAMKFTRLGDHKLVNNIMTDLVKQFRENWEQEKKRQNGVAEHDRAVLLRWGEFSEQYVEKAEFLRKEKVKCNEIFRTLMQMLVLLVCPVLTLIAFSFDVTEDPSDYSNMISTIFISTLMAVTPTLVKTPLTLEFAKINVGLRVTGLHFVQAFIQAFFFSWLLRFIFKVSPLPFEFVVVSMLCLTIGNKIIYGPKLIHTTHPRTNEKIKVSLKP